MLLIFFLRLKEHNIFSKKSKVKKPLFLGYQFFSTHNLIECREGQFSWIGLAIDI